MIRRFVFGALWRSGVCNLARFARSDQGLILRYHSICADVLSRPEYVSSAISVPAPLFERQVRRLSEKYCCLSLDEIVDSLERGRPLPPRSVALTFDDGYRDNYEFALPILAKYSVPATIYLVSSTLTDRKPLWTSLLRYALTTSRVPRLRLADLNGEAVEYPVGDAAQKDYAARQLTNVLNVLPAGRRDEQLAALLRALHIDVIPSASEWFLDARQIDEMARNGITFGAHTVTHPNLPGIDRSEARGEIEGSKSALEAHLNMQMRHFSYPNSGGLYPHFDDAVLGFVRQAGFSSATTSIPGTLNASTRPFRMERIGINRSQSSPPVFSTWLERNRILSQRTESGKR